MTDQQQVDLMEGGEPRIFQIRGQKVMLDKDLAALYELGIEALNAAVARHSECFTEGFMFQLNRDEFADLKSRFAITNQAAPYVFTGRGLALLSSILIDERELDDDLGSCAPTCSCQK